MNGTVIMGAIKDIAELTIQLLNSKEGRKFAAQIAKIQVLAATIQSEQAAIMEKYAESQLEVIRLNKRIFELETQNKDLQTPPEDAALCGG